MEKDVNKKIDELGVFKKFKPCSIYMHPLLIQKLRFTKDELEYYNIKPDQRELIR